MADNENNTPVSNQNNQPSNRPRVPSTPDEMLDSVNAAIYAIAVGGQSYKIGSRSLTRGDLKELYKIKNDLEAQKANANNNTGLFDDCHVAIFDGR